MQTMLISLATPLTPFRYGFVEIRNALLIGKIS
jgi:hypothetical protein